MALLDSYLTLNVNRNAAQYASYTASQKDHIVMSIPAGNIEFRPALPSMHVPGLSNPPGGGSMSTGGINGGNSNSIMFSTIQAYQMPLDLYLGHLINKSQRRFIAEGIRKGTIIATVRAAGANIGNNPSDWRSGFTITAGEAVLGYITPRTVWPTTSGAVPTTEDEFIYLPRGDISGNVIVTVTGGAGTTTVDLYGWAPGTGVYKIASYASVSAINGSIEYAGKAQWVLPVAGTGNLALGIN